MKKLISLILALVMCLSLFACGKAENEDETKKNNKKDDEKAEYEDQHGELAKEAEEKLPEYVLEAIRAYYGLDFGAELTDKMVASVETLTIDIPAVTNKASVVYVDAAVNGSSFTGTGIRAGGKVYKDRMESIRAQINDLYDKVMEDPRTYKALYSSLYIVTEEWFNTNYEKFLAYSYLIDTETDSYYAYDEYFVDYNPVGDLLKFYSTMLLTNTTAINGDLDLSCLEIFPNLKSVQCDERFNAKNCPVKLETLEASVLKGHYKCGDNLTWTFDGETLTIKGEGDMWDFTDTGTPWWGEISSVVIKEGVTNIGTMAFNSFDSLTDITIPNSVTTIKNKAFLNCSNLANINIPDGVTTIESGAFVGCNCHKSISISGTVASIGGDAFGSFETIEVSPDNKYFTVVDNVLFDKNMTTLVRYSAVKSKTSYTIPDSVTTIGARAFDSCDNLTSINIPASVTTIGGFAFAYCDSLASINIPDSVTVIGDAAFTYCDSLTSMDIPENITAIGRSTFAYCGNLTSINISDGVTSIGDYAFFNCSALKSVDIPGGVSTIEDYAFSCCTNLTSVNIPSSVTSIGDAAFAPCDNLEEITFKGTKSEWEALTADKTWPVILTGVTMVCSDGKID